MLTEDGDEQKQAVALKVKSCIKLRGSEQNQINQIMMVQQEESIIEPLFVETWRQTTR